VKNTLYKAYNNAFTIRLVKMPGKHWTKPAQAGDRISASLRPRRPWCSAATTSGSANPTW